MENKKYYAGVRFRRDLYINFIWNAETETIEVYKNGELITSGGGVTPEELMEILEAYVTKEELAMVLLETLGDYIKKTDLATDENAGIMKTNSSQSIYLDEEGNIYVGGRWGEDPETGGIFFPASGEFQSVGLNSAVISEAKGIEFPATKSFGVITGSAVTCRSAAAGSTEYYVNNTYANRIICKSFENGFVALNQDEAQKGNLAKVISVTLADGSPLVVDSSPSITAAAKRIKIVTDKTINPDSATTTLRNYGYFSGYSSLAVGANIAQNGSRGGNLNVGAHISNDGQFSIIVGNRIVNLEFDGINPLGNAIFGDMHINNGKRYCFVSGYGNDISDGSNYLMIGGLYADVKPKTRMAIGNGTSTTAHSNLFEITEEIKDEGLETEQKYTGINLQSSNGQKYRLYIDDNGTIKTELIV